MRLRLKGINWVRKRLADGRTVTHYYAWRGGPKLKGEPGTPEFIASYQEAHKFRTKPAQGTLFSLIVNFRGSAEYTSQISPSTRRAYAAYLKEIEAEFGDMPIAVIEDKRTRGDFKEWRDKMAANPRRADYAWATLARVLSVAKDRGLITVNPCERGGRLYAGGRAGHVWSEADIGRILAAAKPEMKLVVMLALWTGQRQGDLLALPWSAYDGERITLRQSKTDASIAVKVGGPLKVFLDRAPRKAETILTTQRGTPWTSDGFRASWRKLCARAQIKELTFHDLRGSAVTRLALAGASVPEIASVTGHSLADVATILDRHYLGERTALAEQAITKLEAKENGTAVSIRFQTDHPSELKISAKSLKGLVGAQGLEPWTR